jgi:hypothetical protein
MKRMVVVAAEAVLPPTAAPGKACPDRQAKQETQLLALGPGDTARSAPGMAGKG